MTGTVKPVLHVSNTILSGHPVLSGWLSKSQIFSLNYCNFQFYSVVMVILHWIYRAGFYCLPPALNSHLITEPLKCIPCVSPWINISTSSSIIQLFNYCPQHCSLCTNIKQVICWPTCIKRSTCIKLWHAAIPEGWLFNTGLNVSCILLCSSSSAYSWKRNYQLSYSTTQPSDFFNSVISNN